MQTNKNSEQLFIEEESNRSESFINEQLQRKVAVKQRITTYLNLFKDQ
jgi:hypothetical protein